LTGKPTTVPLTALLLLIATVAAAGLVVGAFGHHRSDDERAVERS
jgi:hypothetical protein